MLKNKLNICQVSLNNNIPLIIENYLNFKKIYKKIKIYVICPNKQLREFENRLDLEDIEIVNEDKIISFKEFNKIYENLSKKINYKEKFDLRLKWYYQQALKITFALNFIKKKNENIIIWDADTVILKKIIFFENDISVKYGNFFEYHKDYYETNKEILKENPKYFISSLNQFVAISVKECDFFIKNYLKNNLHKKTLDIMISKLIFTSIFNRHKVFKGSLFSEYELIGQSNYMFKNFKQKPLLFLRFGLNGKLTKIQKFFAEKLGYKHITYEHARINIKNLEMLNQKQSWFGFLKILFKNFAKFYLRCIIHTIKYNLYKSK
tara:strand:- start:16 stop:981 length:966 start_codon:yes stop_codon:yes gene_type:complete